MSELARHRQEIIERGESTDAIDSILRNLNHRLTQKSGEDAVAALKLIPVGFPYAWDQEYAALSLQDFASSVSNTQLRNFLLRYAIERAEIFASYATSGGEGLARSSHLKELDALLSAV